jgi:hypothetical protein
MTDPQQFLQALITPSLKSNPFPPTSRYSGLDVAELELPDGEMIAFVRRRFLPLPERFALLQEHEVQERDRLDNVTAKYLNDPEQFWRVCDANAAPGLHPDDLTATIGRRLRITLPEGVPGASNA